MANKWKEDHTALKNLYDGLYKLDKRYEFRWPRLKEDLEAYMNALLVLVNKAIEESSINKIVGHDGLIYVPEFINLSYKKKKPKKATKTKKETTKKESNLKKTEPLDDI